MILSIHKAEKEKDNFGGPAIVYPVLLSVSGFSLAHWGRFDEGIKQLAIDCGTANRKRA